MRKLLTLIVAALGAMLLMASQAAATNPIHVSDEVNGGECPALNVSEVPPDEADDISGGCAVHVVGSHIDLAWHPLGHVETCDNEYTLRVDSNGDGYITDFVFTNTEDESLGLCDFFQACETTHEGQQAPWQFGGEGIGGGMSAGEVDVCLITPIPHCEGDFPIVLDNAVTHARPDGPGNTAEIGNSMCEVTGEWTVEHTGNDESVTEVHITELD